MAGISDDSRVFTGERRPGKNCHLEVCGELRNPLCQPCYCEASIQTKAEWFCPECYMFICPQCYDAHEEVSASVLNKANEGKETTFEELCGTCFAHEGSVNDTYCINHNDIVCMLCTRVHHKYCQLLRLDAFNDAVCLGHFEEFSKQVKSANTSLVSIKSELEHLIDNIELNRQRMINTTQTIRDQIILKAEQLHAETVLTINNICCRKTTHLSRNLNSVSEMISALSETIPDIDDMINATLNPSLLIRIQSILEEMRQYKRGVEEMYKETNISDLSLTINPEIDTFFKQTNYMGKVEEHISNIEILNSLPEVEFPCCSKLITEQLCERNKRRLSQIGITKMEPLNVKMAEDFLCIINGMDIANNGNLLLADWNNKKVKVFSPDHKLNLTVALADNPFAIAVINDKTAAVSTNDKSLHILDIEHSNSIQIQKSLYLGYLVTGMTPVNGNLVVTRWNKPASVKMIDISGREIWSVSNDQNGQTLFKKPRSVISYEINGQTMVVVTDWGKDTLTVLDAETGKIIKIIDVEERAPHGVTADKDGNIYVCYFHTKEICVWSKDFEESRILLSGNVLSSGPRDILYNEKTDELYVSYRITDQADRFQLSLSVIPQQ